MEYIYGEDSVETVSESTDDDIVYDDASEDAGDGTYLADDGSFDDGSEAVSEDAGDETYLADDGSFDDGSEAVSENTGNETYLADDGSFDDGSEAVSVDTGDETYVADDDGSDDGVYDDVVDYAFYGYAGENLLDGDAGNFFMFGREDIISDFAYHPEVVVGDKDAVIDIVYIGAIRELSLDDLYMSEKATTTIVDGDNGELTGGDGNGESILICTVGIATAVSPDNMDFI